MKQLNMKQIQPMRDAAASSPEETISEIKTKAERRFIAKHNVVDKGQKNSSFNILFWSFQSVHLRIESK